MAKAFKILWKKKIILLITLTLLGGGYFIYQKYFVKQETVRYITAKVERGNLVTSISGTGQISVSDQVDVKVKASGDVIFVADIKPGTEVKSGTLLVQVDSSDAAKAVRDAEQNLDSAKLSLTKLIQPADRLTILQSENALAAAQENKITSENNLNKAYDDGFTDVDNAFLDLPGV